MPSLITPELLTAIGGLLGTGGVIALVRVWREPSPKPGSPDAAAVALARNTDASNNLASSMGTMTGQFGDNLRMFAATLEEVKDVSRNIEETRRAAESMSVTLTRILDALNRRAP